MAATTKLGRVGLVLKGEYSPSTQYEKLDVVTHNGSAYAAKQPTQGIAPPDAAYWQVLADTSAAAEKANRAAENAGAAASTAAEKAEAANSAANAANTAAASVDAKVESAVAPLKEDVSQLSESITELNGDLIEVQSTLNSQESLTGVDYTTLNFDDIINANVVTNNSVSIFGKNLYSSRFSTGKAHPNGIIFTARSDNALRVEATEIKKYNRIWWIIPNGHALIGRYMSGRMVVDDMTAGIQMTAGVAWVRGSAFVKNMFGLGQSNNYTYANKTITAPELDDNQLAFYVDLSGVNYSAVGDYVEISNIQIEIAILPSDFEPFSGVVTNGGTVAGLTGNKTLFSDSAFDVNYLQKRDIIGSTYPMVGKKVLIMGDSISTGPSSNKQNPNTNYENYNKWVDCLISNGYLSDETTYNHSIHATGFVAHLGDGDNDFLTRLQAIEDKDSFDYVILFGGINDFIQSIPMGESGGDANTQFIPAVDAVINLLVTQYTHARIIIVSPLRGANEGMNGAQKYVTDYTDYIKSTAKRYCLPLIDATNDSGFCPFVEAFKNRWTNVPSSGSGAGRPDGLHPNAEYMRKYLAPYLYQHIVQYQQK